MKKVYYNKLIRDRVPVKMRKAGAAYELRIADKEEFATEPLKKLAEEAHELSRSLQRDEVLEELADIYTVFEEICKIYNISSQEFLEAHKENVRKKGSFKKRLFLRWAADDGYKAK